MAGLHLKQKPGRIISAGLFILCDFNGEFLTAKAAKFFAKTAK